MLIVPVDKLREGMQLADNVDSTTALEYQTLLLKGTFLSSGMIEMLKEKGIKTVHIVGGGIADGAKVDPSIYAARRSADDERNRERNERIGKALRDLDEIFDYKHCLRVAMLSASVCGELNMTPEQTKEVVVAGLLHDIGKSNIDHDIIIKPGKLTNEEFDEIKRHPLIGYNILKAGGNYSPNILAGVLYHQEKYDGSGYPTGISGDKIPLIARIMTVCDVFDALTSNRPYRVPWSVAETEEYILGGSGTHFDLTVTQAFLRAFNPYPVGTMVQLSDGRHGVVIAHSSNVLRPTVRIMGKFAGEELDLMNDFRFLTISVTGLYMGDDYTSN